MLGKPEWFTRRKYGGWGIFPKTWQGWVYIVIFLIPLFIFKSFEWNQKTDTIFTIAWATIFLFDCLDIMRQLKKDEREKIHEAIAERNALWGILIILIIGVFYDIIKSGINQQIQLNPFIIASLVIGLLIKAITNIYLDKKN